MWPLPLNLRQVLRVFWWVGDVFVERLVTSWELRVSEQSVVLLAYLDDFSYLLLNRVLLHLFAAIGHRAVHVAAILVLVDPTRRYVWVTLTKALTCPAMLMMHLLLVLIVTVLLVVHTFFLAIVISAGAVVLVVHALVLLLAALIGVKALVLELLLLVVLLILLPILAFWRLLLGIHNFCNFLNILFILVTV